MTTMKLPKKVAARQHEIVADFLKAIDQHLDDIVSGQVTEMHEIRDFARLLFIHPTHLSNTIKLTTGRTPCFFYEEKILAIAKDLLLHTPASIASIAERLTYDPSNFTKFFKHFEGVTPKQFRDNAYYAENSLKSEAVTI
jgi:AraC-like DNA-binding protein